MIDRASPNPSLPTRPEMPRWAAVLLILLAAGIVGGVAGLLSHAAGNNIPAAILSGGAAFAGAVGLLLAIAHYAGAR